jgi:hypothetical protein
MRSLTHDLNLVTIFLPHALLALAAVGAVVSWVRPVHGLPPFWLGAALTVGTTLFILFVGTWGPESDLPDWQYFGLGGRVPYNDAGLYFLGTFNIGYSGRWGPIPSIRPLAAAARDIITASAGLSYPISIIIQALLLSLAMAFAAWRIARWLGPWSALAFVGFVLIMQRTMLGTAATENTGLIWSLLSMGFIAEAMRTRSFPSAALAIALMSAAQMTRTGAVLLIPIMMLWGLTFASRRTFVRVSLILLLAGAGPLLFSLLLGHLFGAPNISGGWNFAYVACEVTRGIEWYQCRDLAVAMGTKPDDAPAMTSALNDLARQGFVDDPHITIRTISENVLNFLSSTPRHMLEGYSFALGLPPWMVQALLVGILPGLLLHAWRAPWREWLFWALAAFALIASAGIMFKHDGWRTLYATHPLIALLLCIGWRMRTVPPSPNLSFRPAVLSLASVAVVMLVVPVILHATMAARPSQDYRGGIVPTGFIVISDNDPRSDYGDVPVKTVAQFRRLIAVTPLESDWGQFVEPMVNSLPFAVFWTPRIGQPDEPIIVYFGPPDVLIRRDVPRWKFQIVQPPWKNKNALVELVVSEEPL